MAQEGVTVDEILQFLGARAPDLHLTTFDVRRPTLNEIFLTSIIPQPNNMWNIINFEVLRALKRKVFGSLRLRRSFSSSSSSASNTFQPRTRRRMRRSRQQAFSRPAKIGEFDDSGLISQPLLAAQHITPSPAKLPASRPYRAARWMLSSIILPRCFEGYNGLRPGSRHQFIVALWRCGRRAFGARCG